MNKYLALLATLICLGLATCTYDKKELEIQNNHPQPSDCDTTGLHGAISYCRDIKPIITTYCYGKGDQTCHVSPSNQGASGNFTTYEGLYSKVKNGTLEDRVFVLKDMPPSNANEPKKLSAADSTKLRNWIQQGAKNN